MTRTDTTTGTQPIPELAGFKPFYGVQICPIGDDGETIVALGHHSPRRTLAAFNAYARSIGETSLNHWLNIYPIDRIAETVRQAWGVLLGECGDCTDLDLPSCEQCQVVRQGAWWVKWNATEDTPGAFPITVLET